MSNDNASSNALTRFIEKMIRFRHVVAIIILVVARSVQHARALNRKLADTIRLVRHDEILLTQAWELLYPTLVQDAKEEEDDATLKKKTQPLTRRENSKAEATGLSYILLKCAEAFIDPERMRAYYWEALTHKQGRTDWRHSADKWERDLCLHNNDRFSSVFDGGIPCTIQFRTKSVGGTLIADFTFSSKMLCDSFVQRICTGLTFANCHSDLLEDDIPENFTLSKHVQIPKEYRSLLELPRSDGVSSRVEASQEVLNQLQEFLIKNGIPIGIIVPQFASMTMSAC